MSVRIVERADTAVEHLLRVRGGQRRIAELDQVDPKIQRARRGEQAQRKRDPDEDNVHRRTVRLAEDPVRDHREQQRREGDQKAEIVNRVHGRLGDALLAGQQRLAHDRVVRRDRSDPEHQEYRDAQDLKRRRGARGSGEAPRADRNHHYGDDEADGEGGSHAVHSVLHVRCGNAPSQNARTHASPG